MKMWKCFAVVAACALSCLVSASNLERFVPDDAMVLVKLRPRMLSELSAVKDNDNTQIRKLREVAERYNIFGGDGLPSQALIVLTAKSNNPAVLVPAVNSPEEMKAQLGKLAQEFPGLVELADLPTKDYPGFRLLAGKDGKKNSFDIYYLAKDVAALTFDGSLPPRELKAGDKPTMLQERLKDFGELEMMRAVGAPQNAAALANTGFGPAPTLVMTKLSKSTDEKIAFVFNSVLEFDKPESAMQVPFTLQLVLGIVVQQLTSDPQLGEQIRKEIKIRADGNKVLIDASISEDLVKSLKDKFPNQIPDLLSRVGI